MRRLLLTAFLWSLLARPGLGQDLSPEVHRFVKVEASVVALTHLRVVDGTGSTARQDQTIILRGGKIESVGDSATISLPPHAEVMDLQNHTVIPGLVGMHNHMYYRSSIHRDAEGHIPNLGISSAEIPFTAPRLYLAGGVTTMRTAGSNEPYADLNVKRQIETGKLVGPKMDVTGPYLEGPSPVYVEMHELRGPEDARKDVEYWAGQGVTSFKAYMHITRAELAAAIDEAHKLGLKITGHLCAVGYREAIAMGIDNLEHGPIFSDSEFDSNKQPDVCPPLASSYIGWARTDVSSPQVQELIHDLVAHEVAITSTLPVFEQLIPGRPTLQERVLEAMAAESKVSYLEQRTRGGSGALGLTVPWEQLLKKEMEFERAFVKAGGLLLAGPDPTGIGGVLPGFGDQREVELLVEAGFSPVEAIHIATSNGAQYLGQLDHIGTISVGKQADLVVIKGDPSQKIEDIENVEIVFKDGIGYDSAKLIESVRGQVGIR